jgi:hypothetical protein
MRSSEGITEGKLKVIEVRHRWPQYDDYDRLRAQSRDIKALIAEVRRLQGWPKAAREELEQVARRVRGRGT